MKSRKDIAIWLNRNFRTFINYSIRSTVNRISFIKPILTEQMSVDSGDKRGHDGVSLADEPQLKSIKISEAANHEKYGILKHGKGRPVPQGVLQKLTPQEIQLLEDIKTSCTDLEKIQLAIQLRSKYRLSVRLPEDDEDSTYFMKDSLRRVYPYNYLYQTYAKRRWIGRKLKDVLKEEFRDLPDDQLKDRFDRSRVLVNGQPVKVEYVIKDNDFITNRNHRHELPVLSTPIKIIHQDKETLVIDKPPSIPIHPCGRYRHNSVVNILRKEYNFQDVKVVHRLDRLVSGVLMIALNSGRANMLENLIKNRDVQKEYVCRVVGEFPTGDPDDDSQITVDQPLETIPGKIGITVALPEGKQSITKFRRLNFNGKTSTVLCKPLTGRMHQIRVHLQYLGYPIVNDGLYNCSSFGPEKGKGGRYGKSLAQLSSDVVSEHRASSWLMSEQNDITGLSEIEENKEEVPSSNPEIRENKTLQFTSEEERQETMSALAHYFNKESCEDLEEKWKYDPEKLIEDPTCRDCRDKFHDPPLRSLYLYLHALKYSGAGWCYESEMPVWAQDTWKY